MHYMFVVFINKTCKQFSTNKIKSFWLSAQNDDICPFSILLLHLSISIIIIMIMSMIMISLFNIIFYHFSTFLLTLRFL